jgi:hypothetical protein
MRIDEGAAHSQVFARQETFDRDGTKIGVGDETRRIGEAELDRLEDEVRGRDRIRLEKLLEIEGLQHPQGHQNDEPLTVGWEF